MGWDRKAYKYCAGEHSNTHLGDKPPLLAISFTCPLESNHGDPHPVSLVPSGLPTQILRPLLGGTARRLATHLALFLVLSLDAPFLHALVQLG